jgi:hypothetical protein
VQTLAVPPLVLCGRTFRVEMRLANWANATMELSLHENRSKVSMASGKKTKKTAPLTIGFF